MTFSHCKPQYLINPIIDANLLPIVPGRGLVTEMATKLRLEYLNKLNINTAHLNSAGFDLIDIRKNIESYIGSVEIHLGLVGPLLFNENGIKEFVYCPAGTVEGALIASMNWGTKTFSLSGGYKSHIKWQRMTRTPLFLVFGWIESSNGTSLISRHLPSALPCCF